MIMARTKKQTLENASERKRLIQEEILKETYAKRRKEDVPCNPNEHNCFSAQMLNNIKINSTSSRSPEENCANGAYLNNNPSFKAIEAMPEARIFISDFKRKQTRPSSSKNEMDYLANKRQHFHPPIQTASASLKTSPKGLTTSPAIKKMVHNASLKNLKAVSEKVREEKSKKLKPCLGLFNGDSINFPSVIPDDSASSSYSHSSQENIVENECIEVGDAKPKVNIFIDNVGQDLGKRIRSPRRLSQDMIPLPIFPTRRWSNSPKDPNLGKVCELSNSIIPMKNEVQKSQSVSLTAPRKCVSVSEADVSFCEEMISCQESNSSVEIGEKLGVSPGKDITCCQHQKHLGPGDSPGTSHPSLLCAMLIGGTEVADHYTQDRIRYKSHSQDTSLDSSSSHADHSNHSVITDSCPAPGKGKSEQKVAAEDFPAGSEADISLCNGSDLKQKSVIPIENPAAAKKVFDLSSKLRLLNEDVLKLVDQSVGYKSPSDDSVTSDDADVDLANSLLKKDDKELNILINNLGTRLCDSMQAPFSTPVDVEFVKKLLQACPKTSPSPDTDIKFDMAGNVQNNPEDNVKDEKSCIAKDKLDNSLKECEVKPEPDLTACASSKETSDCVPGVSVVSDNQRSSDSLSELDAEAITLAATSALVKSDYSERLLQGSPEASKEVSSDTNKQSLFECRPTTPSQAADCFKQSSSGNIRPSSAVLTSSQLVNSNKENQVKSKLGSKIPVPGSGGTSRSLKKTWRVPRTVMEPKPLTILSRVEKSSPETGNVFTCANLQKYLSIPSNRVIVAHDKKLEMQAADAIAIDEQKKVFKIKTEKKKGDNNDLDYPSDSRDPDFDEIDGVLFISFADETELNAHLRVEKKLDWEKDDTMLRISRARAFEEAKAHNEDMGEFKLKHLRGQHMRWKKYRRMFHDEVKVLKDCAANNTPLPLDRSKKTADITKIKGWKKKVLIKPEPNEVKTEVNNEVISPFSMENSTYQQLFTELNLDWKDLLIHQKLGGWPTDSCRTIDNSSGAYMASVSDNLVDSMDIKDFIPNSSMQDLISDVKFDICNSNCDKYALETKRGTEPVDIKISSDISETKDPIIFPVLTDKMAKNALKTLVDVKETKKGTKNKSKKKSHKSKLPSLQTFGALQAAAEPDASLTAVSPSQQKYFCTKSLSSPSSPVSNLSLCSSSLSVSVATTPLLMDEAVPEGVDIAAECISSPSLADSSSIKSCSKPGCRYGCICHLCSVGEVSAPTLSPKSRSQSTYCDKEYCRLGCICDSIDPEKPLVCSKDQQVYTPQSCHDLYDADDIPYLPSCKKRPKSGERFSNLPQRERTHRASKNLDAVTRKAMNVYETSEIYCEKVERTKKKQAELASSPTAQTCTNQNGTEPVVGVMDSTSSNFYEICSEFAEEEEEEEEDSNPSAGPEGFPNTTESSEISEVSGASSQLSHSAIELDEYRKVVQVIEPSAHKRKRKSHPLSNEIFSASSCARAQPFKNSLPAKVARLNTLSEDSSAAFEVCVDNEDDKLANLPALPVVDTPATTYWDYLPLTRVVPQVSECKFPAQCNTQDKSDTSTAIDCNLQKPVTEPLDPADNKSGSSTREIVPNSDWQTSMVCLKSKSAPKNEMEEDDVQEEDEVKLLEFAANCCWESAKREILGSVSQCLVRGHYPHPRIMNVCDFVVEILPKSQHPSIVPLQFRLKLPEKMFSIRVRITRREQLATSLLDNGESFIDLCGSSPVKKSNVAPSGVESTSSARMGISGLSKLCLSSSGPHAAPKASTPTPTFVFKSSQPDGRDMLPSSRAQPSKPPAPLPQQDAGFKAVTVPKGAFVKLGAAPTVGRAGVPSQGTSLLPVKGDFKVVQVSMKDGLPEANKGDYKYVKVIRKDIPIETSKGDVKFVQVVKREGNIETLKGDVKIVQLPKKDGPIEVVVEPPPGKKIISFPMKFAKNHLAANKTSLINLPNPGLLPLKHQGEKSSNSSQEANSPAVKKSVSVKDEMIMVFDASHVKASQGSVSQMLMAKSAAPGDVTKQGAITAEKTMKTYPEMKGVKLEQIVTIKKLDVTDKSPISSKLFDLSHDTINLAEKPLLTSTPMLTSKAEQLKAGNSGTASPLFTPFSVWETASDTPKGSKKRKRGPVVANTAKLHPAKRSRQSHENPIVTDEDSIISTYSCPDVQAASSPVSLGDRPKSVMSTSLSTGSVDDGMVLLSSDDDVDVGEDDTSNCDSSLGQGSSHLHFNCVYSELKEMYNSNFPAFERKVLPENVQKKIRKEKKKRKNKLEHHNHLERMRRSKLKELFSHLQDQVLQHVDVPKNQTLSKANVLIEAKNVILKLNQKNVKGLTQISKLENKNKNLKEALNTLQGGEMPPADSPSIVLKMSTGKDGLEMVDLVSDDEGSSNDIDIS